MKLRFFIVVFIVSIGCSDKRSKKPIGQDVRAITNVANEWIKLNDQEMIDSYFRIGNKIYCGELLFNEFPMENVDMSSFEIFAGSNYARDSKKVYYPLSTICLDGRGWGVCYCNEYLVEEADPLSFRYLGNDYASDKNYGYLRGIRIEGSDGKTFEIINGPKYFLFARDKDNVYLGNKIFQGADPSTFKYDGEHPENDTLIYQFIVKDTNNTWKFIPPQNIVKIK